MSGETMKFQPLSNGGYLPGHNGSFVSAYADRIENYMISNLT